MRRILLFILTLLCISVVAQDPCTDVISVTEEYSEVLAPGTHYFVSSTSYLPLTIQIVPQGPEIVSEPQAEFDLTCTPGYYEDEGVQQLVNIVTEAGFSLPIKPYLLPTTIDGAEGYSIHFNNAVFSQLYVKYGIVYPIEVHVAIKIEQQCLVNIFSESTHAQCVNDATEINLGDSIFIEDGDETAVIEWHVSQLARDEYAIIWNGQPASFTMGANCDVKQGDANTQQMGFGEKDTMFLIPEYSLIFLQQFKTPFMYARHYGGAGWLIMKPYNVPRFLQNIVIGGVNAVIDNENMTITAILPYGTDRMEALLNAVCSPSLSPLTQTGPEIVNDGNTLIFGPLAYDLQNVVVAENTLSHDATLTEIAIDGIPIDDFSPSITNYDIIVTTPSPIITAQCSDGNASYQVSDITTLPATVTITVTAEAGNTLLYTLNISYDQPPLSSDATLSDIIIGQESLPGFSPQIFEYEYDVIDDELPEMTVVATDDNATIVIIEPQLDNDFTAQIIVTAQDESNTLTYTIKFNIVRTGIADTEADSLHDFTHARVYSATGKLVAEDYSVAHLPSGIYLLRTATASKKIIVY